MRKILVILASVLAIFIALAGLLALLIIGHMGHGPEGDLSGMTWIEAVIFLGVPLSVVLGVVLGTKVDSRIRKDG